MRKILLVLVVVVLVGGAIIGWLAFGSGTGFSEKSKSLFVYTGKNTKKEVLATIEKDNIVKSSGLFTLIAGQLDVWENLRPGRYEIKKGESLYSIARMLRNNRQTPVKLVINKLRTQQDLARVIGKNFETDSAAVIRFLQNNDSLNRFDVDTNTAMTMVIPNTYNIYWNLPAGDILERLHAEQQAFWKKNQRLQKAAQMSLTPEQVYTIASIVEEETNKQDEKGNVASVYILVLIPI